MSSVLREAAATPSVTVRDAQRGDIPAIQAIYAHHVEHGVATFEEVPPSVEEMQARHAGIVAQGMPYLVAERDARIVGYAYASTYRARPAYRHTVENSVYLAHDAARQGVGTALLTELIARCEQGPWRQMIAVIGDSQNHGSIGVHRKLGFTLIGTLPAVGFKLGRWVDTVLMQRPLGPGSATLPTGAPAPGSRPGPEPGLRLGAGSRAGAPDGGNPNSP